MSSLEVTGRPLSGRIALVTGAGKGIGPAVADALEGRGASVCGFDVHFGRESGRASASRLSFTGSVTEAASIARCLETVAARWGARPDIVVNNAAVTSHVPFLELTEDEWSRVLAVNLTGTFLVCRATAGAMAAAGRGTIINVASELGLVGAPHLAHYCASKGGIIALSKALAREMAPHGVSVNIVAPGPIETDMLVAYPEEYNDVTLATIPLGRWGTVRDVASTVAFLASDSASFYTGWVFSPNGGVVM